MAIPLRKLISGGQTGADRAALDTAIELHLAHGGSVPRDRWAEDGPLAARYQMTETESGQVAVRTQRNVEEACATIIFSHGALTGGSAWTFEFAERLGKPVLHVDLLAIDESCAAETITSWLTEQQPAVLNVAGPRASNDPLIYDAVSRVLRRVLGG